MVNQGKLRKSRCLWFAFVAGVLVALVHPRVHAQTTSDILGTNILSGDSADAAVQRFLISQFPSFPNPASSLEWQDHASRVRDTLRQILTNLPIPEQVPHRIESRGILDGDGYRIEKLIFEVYEGFEIPVNIYIPDSLNGRAPVVLNPNGFFLEGKATDWVQRRCGNLAKMGYIAISWDFIHTGERGGWNGIGLSGNNTYYSVWWRIAGANSLALSVGETIAILDLVMTMPQADTTRIGIVGSSQGAVTALLASAIDERIGTTVSVVPSMPAKKAPFNSTGHFTERNYVIWDGTFTPSLFTDVSDMAEFIALCAPRKVLMISGTSDITPPGWIGEEVEQARQIYGLVGNSDALRHDSVEMGHEYGLAARLRTYNWLKRWFDNDTNEVISEFETILWSLDSLRCGMDPTSATIISEGNALLSGITKPDYLPSTAIEARMMQHEIDASFIDNAHQFSDSILGITVYGTIANAAMSVTRSVLDHKSGLRTPFIFVAPVGVNTEVCVVMLSDSGKRSVSAPLVDSLIAHGYSVCAFDPLGTGEMAFENFSTRVLSYYLEMFDQTLISVGRSQADEMIRYIKQRGISRIAVVADGPLSQALASTVSTSEDVGALAVNNGLDGYQESLPGGYPMKAPAFKQFKNSFRTSDTPGLSAIVSPKPLLLSNIRNLDGSLLTDSSRTLGTVERFHSAFGKNHLLTQVQDSSTTHMQTFQWLAKVYPPFGRLHVIGIPDSVVLEDSAYSSGLLTNHPGNQQIDLLEAPEWLSVNSETGLLSGVAIARAETAQVVRLRVLTDLGDSLQYSYRLNVIHQNHPPVVLSLPDTVGQEDSLYTYAIDATDIDTMYFGDILRFAMSSAPSWLHVDSISGLLSGVPSASDVGDTVVTIIVTDGNGGEAVQQFPLRIHHTNHAPVFASQPVIHAVEDSVYIYHSFASDVDSILFGDGIKYSFISQPAWLSIDSVSGVVSGTPRIDNLADTAIVIVARDDSGSSVEQSFHISIRHVNHSPVIISTPILDAYEDSQYTYTLAVVDPDTLIGEFVDINVLRAPGWLSMDQGSAHLRGTPGAVHVGVDTVIVEVRDDSGGTDVQLFRLQVHHVNHAPVFVSIPETVAVESIPYEYVARAQDADTLFDDSIRYRAIVLPPWLEFNELNGVLKGTPTGKNLGIHEVILRATDRSNSDTDQHFAVRVMYLNHPPVITSVPVTTTQEDSMYIYAIQAFDEDIPNGDYIRYHLKTSATWLTIDSTTGTITGVPHVHHVGISRVSIVAYDLQGDTARQEFMLRVEHTNHPPAILSDPVREATEGEWYEYRVIASDPDSAFGDLLRYRLSIRPTWLSIDSVSGLITGLPTRVNAKDTVAEVEVLELVGGSRTKRGESGPVSVRQLFPIVITRVNQLPEFISIPDTTAIASEEYSYTVQVFDADSSDVVRCELADGPEFLVFDTRTSTLRGIVPPNVTGKIPVLLMAQDNHGGKTYQSFSIQVVRTNKITKTNLEADTSAVPAGNEVHTVSSTPVFGVESGTFSVAQNFPNPFNPQTTITYSLPEESLVNIAIYNVLGQHIATLMEGYQSTGIHSVSWRAEESERQLPGGVYFCRMHAALRSSGNTNLVMLRMLLVK